MVKDLARTSKKTKKSQGLASNKKGEVRIIAGEFRGRKLPVLNAEGLRPTSDRVRETLFNWLQFDIVGRNVLDVFAGSGVLGFEALSRGAKHVTMLELDRKNYQQLIENKQQLKIENLTLHNLNALVFLNNPAPQTFDIVFLDPPFNQGLMLKTIELLFKNNWLSNNSLLYIEQENSLAWEGLPEGWVCKKEKQTSQVKFGLFYYGYDYD